MSEENTEGQPQDNGEPKDTKLETQPTPQLQDPRIEAVQQGLAEVRGMMGQLLKQGQEPKKEEPTPELTQEEFFKNPQVLLDRFGKMLDKAVAPLNAFKDEYKGERQIDAIKNKIKKDPKLAKALEVVGDDFDTALATMAPEHLNDGAVSGLLLTLFGHKTLNAGEGGIVTTKKPDTILPSNSQAKDMSDVPAHMRPSGSKATPPPTPQKTELSVDEERVMQKFGYDPKNEEHRREFASARDEGENRGNRVMVVGKEVK